MVVSLSNSKEEQPCGRQGDYYITRFLKRHPEVATTVARAIDCDRVLAMNSGILEAFFECLQDCIDHKIGPSAQGGFRLL